VKRKRFAEEKIIGVLASLIVRFMRSTWPFVQGWLGLVSRCSIPLASQIMSKRICRE
jgi:hypothetical protein